MCCRFGSDMFHWTDDLLVVNYYISHIMIRKPNCTTYGATVSKLKLIFSGFGIPDVFISEMLGSMIQLNTANSKLDTLDMLNTRRITTYTHNAMGRLS